MRAEAKAMAVAWSGNPLYVVESLPGSGAWYMSMMTTLCWSGMSQSALPFGAAKGYGVAGHGVLL